MEASRGSQRRRLLLFFNKGRRLAGALNSVQFNSIQAQFNSNSIQIELELEMAVRVGFEMRKILGHCCLSWLRLQKFRKQFEQIERADIKSFSNNWKTAAVQIVGFDLEKMERVVTDDLTRSLAKARRINILCLVNSWFFC